MRFKLVEGIRNSDNGFIIDMQNDEATDIIKTVTSDDIYISRIDDNVYSFGYKFEDFADSQDRSQFIKQLKFDEVNAAVESFIIRPVRLIQKTFDTNFDLFVYPRSNRSALVDTIVRCMTNILQRNIKRSKVEDIRNIPSNLISDYQALKDVLIIDDINNSENTAEEISRLIRNINKQCDIFIFTIIGKN